MPKAKKTKEFKCLYHAKSFCVVHRAGENEGRSTWKSYRKRRMADEGGRDQPFQVSSGLRQGGKGFETS
jgi:hypothetical protein